MSKLMNYLPPFYSEIKDFTELMSTEEVEVNALRAAIDRLLDDQFVMTASERSIKRREQMLGIQADPATESLEFRRLRLINRYSTKPPFTIRFLQERLNSLVGPGRATVDVDPRNFVLSIAADIDNASIFKEVEHTVRTTIPANLVYQQKTALTGRIGISEHITTRSIHRQMRLGTTWRLGVVPISEAGPEVIIK
ncbi:phage portal protein [Tumebacillus algifaecis]|uniref:Phage portal protein n=1 Tax=Tumebacillus algifaecis TaxID=1214604 RepID=A0A223D5P7_9BACL|nr:putative phage tail protein [Tumebacillus algifaecis]ASS76807.1 phage portal protein [Tumebacillus algifaecis]